MSLAKASCADASASRSGALLSSVSDTSSSHATDGTRRRHGTVIPSFILGVRHSTFGDMLPLRPRLPCSSPSPCLRDDGRSVGPQGGVKGLGETQLTIRLTIRRFEGPPEGLAVAQTA